MMIITQLVPLLLPVTEVECFCIESNSEHETRHGLTQLKIAMCAYLLSRGTIEQSLNFFDISEIMSSSEADKDDAVPVKDFQWVAISYWLNAFLANKEYQNISLKADVSISLIGREKRSRVLS